jgi:hypothetical protein
MAEKIYTKEQICHLVDKFKTRNLSKTEWTHESHLTVAIWHVVNYDFYDAVCRLKSGIINLNSSHQTENTSNSGYHETLTIFWMRIISLFVTSNQSLSIEQLVNKFLDSELAKKELPYKFYKKDELLSAEPRSIYIEPTLREVNESTVLEINLH